MSLLETSRTEGGVEAQPGTEVPFTRIWTTPETGPFPVQHHEPFVDLNQPAPQPEEAPEVVEDNIEPEEVETFSIVPAPSLDHLMGAAHFASFVPKPEQDAQPMLVQSIDKGMERVREARVTVEGLLRQYLVDCDAVEASLTASREELLMLPQERRVLIQAMDAAIVPHEGTRGLITGELLTEREALVTRLETAQKALASLLKQDRVREASIQHDLLSGDNDTAVRAMYDEFDAMRGRLIDAKRTPVDHLTSELKELDEIRIAMHVDSMYADDTGQMDRHQEYNAHGVRLTELADTVVPAHLSEATGLHGVAESMGRFIEEHPARQGAKQA